MKTFNVSKTEEPITFRVGKEEFEAVSADKLSASVLATYFQHVNEGNLFKAHDFFFETVLTKDSFERFNYRLHSKDDPITVRVLGDIASWLIGDEYCGGKSWGRGQAIIGFATESWDEFDSWCLIHNVSDPWKLPSYRFAALVVFFMKHEKTEESVNSIDQTLATSDGMLHPFHDATFRKMVKVAGEIFSSRSRTKVDNVIYDSRFVTELPIEERKRQEAREKGRAYRVPEWWRGERANYAVAKQMMVTLPKKKGKPVKEQ